MRRIRFQKRTEVTLARKILNPIMFVILAFLFCGIFLAALGYSPLTVYAKMCRSIFSARGIQKSIVAGLPLMFTGLAVAFSYRMNLNNIGADGQYAMGSIFCIWFALYGPDMPAVPKMILMILFAMAGGALAGLLAALPKAFWGVSETILTMMLNYVILLFLDYLTHGPWKEPNQIISQTAKISEKYWLPEIGSTGINVIVLFAAGLAVLIYLFHRHTVKGYEMEVVRTSPGAAHYAGINIRKNTLIVLAISGAIAGLAGFAQIGGIVHRVQTNMPNGAGYTGIVIAFLSYLNPLAVIIVAVLFGALQISAVAVQILGVPSQVATMIQGSIMLFVIAGEFFYRYRPVMDGKPEKERDVG